jgi:hypothetical protein
MKPLLPGVPALVFVMVIMALLLTGCAESSGWGVNASGMPLNTAPASGE